jgi:hypothetical protein
MSSFGQWTYTADRDATILAYGRTERGGADTCDCAGCRNFRVARAGSFPAGFLALLDKLGIDPRKDAEVYRNARLAPGRHCYGGWYHFVGTLDQTADCPAVDLGHGFSVRQSRCRSRRARGSAASSREPESDKERIAPKARSRASYDALCARAARLETTSQCRKFVRFRVALRQDVQREAAT